MANTASLGKRWEDYRATKTMLFWSCAACVVATIIIGFNWGGWVTGGTADKMTSDAANGARAQLAAAECVIRFKTGPDAAAQLTALKGAGSYQQGGMLEKSGWVTFAGSKDPVVGAGDLCAQQLLAASPAPVKG